MYSRVLNVQTLGRVIALCPRVESTPQDLAREILGILLVKTNTEPPQGDSYWILPLNDLSAQIVPSTPRLVGQILSEMGLSKHRANDGYRVYWNQAQLDLLCQELDVHLEELRRSAS